MMSNPPVLFSTETLRNLSFLICLGLIMFGSNSVLAQGDDVEAEAIFVTPPNDAGPTEVQLGLYLIAIDKISSCRVIR